jgi:Protein of unknown function (DUF2961)
MSEFNGLGMGLHNISRLSKAKTRSISAENFTGEKGNAGRATEGTGANAARELGKGWKVSPSIHIQPRQTVTLADIEGPGALQHIWNTVHPTWWRRLILRVYWDGEDTPSIETPIGDFFCNGWCERRNISSLPIAVNPAGGFNSYWEMPFRKSARITLAPYLSSTRTASRVVLESEADAYINGVHPSSFCKFTRAPCSSSGRIVSGLGWNSPAHISGVVPF